MSIAFVCLLTYFSQQPRYLYIILIASSEYEKFNFSETGERVKQGDFPVMLLSSEALVVGQWRAIMSDKLFQERLHTIVVNEALCITEW